MPQGIQIFDSAAKLLVDNTTRLTLYFGTITLVKGVNNTATITDIRFANGKPFYVSSTMTSKGSVLVKFTGNTMSCTLVDGIGSGDYSVTIIYGVY